MNPNDPHLFDVEINFTELLNVIWEGKKIITLITSVIAIGSVVYSLMLTNHYRSESIVVARASQEAGAFSQYAGLASLAGVSMPNSGGDKVFELIEIIKSRKFIKHLLTFENILPSIMAAKSYDAASQELYFDPNIYDVKNKTWARKPSYLETHDAYLNDMLTISSDNNTGLVSIMIEHISPVFAKEFLALVIKETNTLKREKDISISNESLSYLKAELSRTPLVEIRESINQLIEAQLETQMVAKINEEYSLIIIEPPFIPEERSKPKRSLIVILATMLGGVLSLAIVLVRHYLLGKEIINKHTSI